MAVCIGSDLAKDMAGEPLLRGVSFKVERRDRLTLSGRNGSGKTTLLRMIAGETGIDGGELVLAKGTRVALHDQRPPRERNLSLREYVLSGSADLVALEQELARLEQLMADGDHDPATLNTYSTAQARLEHAGGYNWRERAMAVVRGLGFTEPDLDRMLATFSGGELTRASLARTLAGDPDLLLLDEPTNHLDIESLEWLENQLTSIDAAVILVAHDRWFLEAVGTAVLELEAGRSRFFKGPWHAWRKEQAARALALGRAIERQQAEIERLERFVTRFRAGTRSRQAQARQKKLDRMERVERGPKDGKSLGFAFDKSTRAGRTILELEKATLNAGDKLLLEDAEMWIERGEHVTLVGPNGAGKTTLIDTLAGARELKRGKLRRGHNVSLGYLSQHAEEMGNQGSVLEATQRATGLTPNKARALLGRFLFSGEDAEKPLEGLSGGERRRLSLAILVSSGANFLIIDEPTNHLDLESREALEDALRSFDGTVLLVSHDRALLDAVGTRTLAIEGHKVASYHGGWADYVRVRDERKAAAEPPKVVKERKKERDKPKPAVSKGRSKRIATLEREVSQAEAALKKLEDELADPDAWSSPTGSERSAQRHAEAKSRIDELYEELVALSEENGTSPSR
ncbi:MAG: ATP-binding cassette, subfamily er 3 [Thermoleophilaceae bacterium]|jgi:ATP-binding cassette subfamily F protein 3|nr:ATP-binding cassette, subfamily er 3 [Thermoleophilaceae bacterium]